MSNDNPGGGEPDLKTRVNVALLDARIAVSCVAIGLQLMEARLMSEPLHSEIGLLVKFAGEAQEAYERLWLVCDELFPVSQLP